MLTRVCFSLALPFPYIIIINQLQHHFTRTAKQGIVSNTMQRDREVRENSTTSGGPFVNSGDFGFRGSTFPSIFGGKDPFDDPFFTRPFGGLFGSDVYSSGAPADNLQHANRSKGPVIEELDSDAEGELEKKQENDVTDATWANKNPLVEHPEDQDNDHGKSKSKAREVSFNTNHNNVEGNRSHTRSASFQRVTYGGINGAYYTATTTRTTGSDGVTLEESKQADRTTGQATHRISRGIQDKGHSVTRKLDSDGKVNTMQTLHNLNEDELLGFEQAWRGNTDRLSHGDRFDFPGKSDRRWPWSTGSLGRISGSIQRAFWETWYAEF
ncbi:uncharacterized protein LOC105171251 isoform X2 [Sesamum indicum]|uniref:Uncharacterized protein LOC105171251 isoform X2 n=1 Tax=Sesamum indicum TaxID=4182 RepID=A0A6I9TZM0_SESIN|nr:uncharacterized protein LOC105171251 isoform X2 [Sesamum indicum]